MCHEEILDLLSGSEHHLYWLVAIYWVVEAKRYWSNSCRLGVTYNIFRHSRMAGGLSLPNPCLAMPVFVIPPEWYTGSMYLLDSCWRAARMLR